MELSNYGIIKLWNYQTSVKIENRKERIENNMYIPSIFLKRWMTSSKYVVTI